MINIRMTPVYQVSTTLIVSQGSNRETANNYDAWLIGDRLARTYVELLRKRPLLEIVIANLQLPMTPEELDKQIQVAVVHDTQLIELSVKNEDPQLAANIANEMVRVLKDLDHEWAASGSSSFRRSVSVVEPAWPNTKSVSPQTFRNTLLATVFGAILMIGVAFVREQYDNTLKSAEEIEALTGMPVLGVIRRIGRGNRGSRPALAQQSTGALAEAYRMLCGRIGLASTTQTLRTLVVTSGEPRAGKSTTAAHLAVAFARSGKRVILIDADLRRPTLHTLFGTTHSSGLSTLLSEADSTLAAHLVPIEGDKLRLLSSGPHPADPAELLSSQRMANLLAACAAQADIVLIDTPALLSVIDPALLARLCDATLLVAREGFTPAETLKATYKSLTDIAVRPLGIVLTGSKTAKSYDRYYAGGAARPRWFRQRRLPTHALQHELTRRARPTGEPGAATMSTLSSATDTSTASPGESRAG